MQNLKTAITKFMKSSIPKIELANVIEVQLDKYEGDDFLEQTQEMLAMYSPRSGKYLISSKVMKERLQKTLEHLAALSEESQ